MTAFVLIRNAYEMTLCSVDQGPRRL